MELPIFESYEAKAAVLKTMHRGDPNIDEMSESMFNTCFPSLSREQAKRIYQYWKDHNVVVNKFEGVHYDDLDFIWYDVRKLPIDDIIAGNYELTDKNKSSIGQRIHVGVHENVIKQIYTDTKEDMKTVKKDLIRMLAKYENSFGKVIYGEEPKRVGCEKRILHKLLCMDPYDKMKDLIELIFRHNEGDFEKIADHIECV